jgi:hypothetical protein
MTSVRSADGTSIAFERSGTGPALIIVDGALCSRAFGPSATSYLEAVQPPQADVFELE